MSENKNTNRTNAKVGRIWSPKSKKEGQLNPTENLILGMTDQHIAMNSK